MTIEKYQRHPTEGDCVILHMCIPRKGPGIVTKEVRDQAYRDALEAAGKLED
jgi:hypothetical protein